MNIIVSLYSYIIVIKYLIYPIGHVFIKNTYSNVGTETHSPMIMHTDTEVHRVLLLYFEQHTDIFISTDVCFVENFNRFSFVWIGRNSAATYYYSISKKNPN